MTTEPPTVLSRIIRFVRQAGAPNEETYDRDGFLSNHAETHAAGLGIGLGAIATATGDWQYVAALLAAAFGINRGPTLKSAKITEDVVQEPHYFATGLALGLFLGSLL